MLFDLGHPHARNEVSPKADYTGGEALIGEVLHAHVGHIEVRRVYTSKIRLPWKARFIGAASIEGLHVGIQAGHDLDNRETLLHAIGCQRLKAIWPAKAFAQTHPPGIPEPEERSSVGMLKVAPIFCDFERTVFVVGVLAGVRLHIQYRCTIMKVAVGGVATD